MNWFTQIADNHIFYLGYKAATHIVPKWKSIAVRAYIAIIMSASWVLTYTICPFFVDTNSEAFTNYYYTPGRLLYTWGSVLYNFYFTIEFVMIMYRVKVLGSKQHSLPAQIISIKCIVHFFTSTGAILQLYYAYAPLRVIVIVFDSE
jgi:hypothetical protein